jgi:hypothetical protein
MDDRIVQLPQLIIQLTPLLVDSKGEGAVLGLLPCGMFATPQDIQKLPLESQGRGHGSLGVLILKARGEVIVRDGFLGGSRSHHCGLQFCEDRCGDRFAASAVGAGAGDVAGAAGGSVSR